MVQAMKLRKLRFAKSACIGCIFWICLGRIMNSWSDKLETWHAENLDIVLNKARKQQFYPGQCNSLQAINISYINVYMI